MRIRISALKLSILLFVLLILPYLMVGFSVRAQNAPLQIDLLDRGAFPTITLRVRHANGLSLSEMRGLQVVESEQLSPVTLAQATPLRVAILVDVWQRMPRELMTLTIEQMNLLAAELNQEWEPSYDRMAVFRPGGADGKSLTAIHDWTGSLEQIVQNMSQLPADMTQSGARENTAINKLLVEALNDLEFSEVSDALKFVVLISNGVDGYTESNTEDLAAILQTAVRNDVQILVVNFPPKFIDKLGSAHLNELAAITNSEVHTLGDAAHLDQIKRTIATGRREGIVRFTAIQNNIPYNQSIQLQGASGVLTSNVLPVAIEPITVNIEEIDPQQPYKAGDTLHFKATLEDSANPLRGQPLTSVEYWFGSGSHESVQDLQLLSSGSTDEPASYEFTIPIKSTSVSTLSLEMQGAIPGLFVSEDQVIPFATLGPTPTAEPTPQPEITEEAEPVSRWRLLIDALQNGLAQINWLNWLIWLSLLLALIALAMVIYFGRKMRHQNVSRNPLTGDRSGTGEGGPYTHKWQSELETQPPKAELLLIQGEGLLPGLITLREELIDFGRDRDQVHILLLSPYVSEVQFRLEERDGHYLITNRGITNPTFVNDAAIMQAHQLRSGEVIRFGPIKYRFISNRLGARTSRIHDWYIPQDILEEETPQVRSTPLSRRRGRTASRTRTTSLTADIYDSVQPKENTYVEPAEPDLADDELAVTPPSVSTSKFPKTGDLPPDDSDDNNSFSGTGRGTGALPLG